MCDFGVSKTDTRICKVCKKEKTLIDNFNFELSASVFLRTCKECINEKRRKNYELSKDKEISIPLPTLKKCPNCQKELILNRDNFYYRSTVGTFASFCKACSSRKRSKKGRAPKGIFTPEVKAKTLLSRYKRLDSKKKLETDLSMEFLINCVGAECTYCKFPATGIDRIDNSVGHTDNNCVPCCYECNIARNNNFSHEEMFIIGETIRQVKLKRISQ